MIGAFPQRLLEYNLAAGELPSRLHHTGSSCTLELHRIRHSNSTRENLMMRSMLIAQSQQPLFPPVKKKRGSFCLSRVTRWLRFESFIFQNTPRHSQGRWGDLADILFGISLRAHWVLGFSQHLRTKKAD